MNLEETTTRRTLLKAALGLGLALSVGARANAAVNPFAAGQVWGGLTSGSLATSDGTIQLNVSSPSSGVLFCAFGAIGVTIAFNGIDSVTITGNLSNSSKIVINGKMPPADPNNPLLTPKFAPSAGGPNYTVSSLFGVVASGTVELSNLVVSAPLINATDENRASLDTFPPDFLGKYTAPNGTVGQLVFHLNALAPSSSPATVNKGTGVVTLNGTRYNFLMTFAAYAEPDGTFRFDLIGDTGRVGGPVLVLSGSLLPAPAAGLAAQMAGGLQLLQPRGGSFMTLLTARYLMTEVA